jgi:Cohesin domain/Bacterial Ig-like domain
MMNQHKLTIVHIALWVLLTCSALPATAFGATLRLSPETGVYTVGNTFTANVVMNTGGKPVNAADAQLTFNPKELTVVSVNRASSVFNLWTLEPTFSNSAGTISFGGGSPTGYTGASGNIMTVTFRMVTAGTTKVNFKTGSILAADGLGTNVLTAMNGGTYTVGAQSTTPPPEYTPPANTPKAPKVISSTHPDESKWYTTTTASLSWTVPQGVTSVRTLLDDSPSTVPTIVYDEPITSRELTDLEDGASYFHVQFKNADGWGRVTHFRINVDTKPPSEFTITEENADGTNPTRTLLFTVTDASPITKYMVQLDGGEPKEFIDTDAKGQYVLEEMTPGHHTVVVEAFDSAGNTKVASYAFEVSAFEAPVFTEYPERVNSGVIPALRGTTRPDAVVTVTVHDGDREFGSYTTNANTEGSFVFIPDTPLPTGVYDVRAIAVDTNGAQSQPSETIRMIVAESGFITVGSFMVRVLSVIVPLVALVIVLIFGSSFLWYRLRTWKRIILRETLEAEDKLRIEFDAIVSKLHANVTELKESRKGKLTKAEQSLIEEMENDLRNAEARIKKEIADIEDIVE